MFSIFSLTLSTVHIVKVSIYLSIDTPPCLCMTLTGISRKERKKKIKISVLRKFVFSLVSIQS